MPQKGPVPSAITPHAAHHALWGGTLLLQTCLHKARYASHAAWQICSRTLASESMRCSHSGQLRRPARAPPSISPSTYTQILPAVQQWCSQQRRCGCDSQPQRFQHIAAHAALYAACHDRKAAAHMVTSTASQGAHLRSNGRRRRVPALWQGSAQPAHKANRCQGMLAQQVRYQLWSLCELRGLLLPGGVRTPVKPPAQFAAPQSDSCVTQCSSWHGDCTAAQRIGH